MKCALTPGGRYFVGCWTLRVSCFYVISFRRIYSPSVKSTVTIVDTSTG
jgi:hypothetical protein